MYEIPPQQILSTDSVTLTVDAVIYYKVFDPVRAACRVLDFNQVRDEKRIFGFFKSNTNSPIPTPTTISIPYHIIPYQCSAMMTVFQIEGGQMIKLLMVQNVLQRFAFLETHFPFIDLKIIL